MQTLLRVGVEGFDLRRGSWVVEVKCINVGKCCGSKRICSRNVPKES